MQRIGVLGSGIVGETLADGFLKHGYEVMRGSREPVKLESWKSKHGPEAWIGTFAQCAEFGELLVLAVKGTAAEAVIDLAGPHISGKAVLDATNPIAESPPLNGVLSFFTGPNESLMERLQRRAPSARFVKAFSSVGAPLMVNPDLGQRPSMFICGNDEAAKRETTAILDRFGWETEDLGSIEAARAIEPLCMLWCIHGFLHNDWTHAFKMLRKA